MVNIPEIAREDVASGVRDGTVVLVEALPEEVFATGHLPGALNIRPRRTEELAPVLLPDQDARVVVYCGSDTCDASLRVAQRLKAIGYGDVHRYVGGKQDWSAAGLPIEGGDTTSAAL
ncbi:rhodanese-like domain-containing protein [Lentzea sp. BCCO 10_0061]|uniref:Rhodanese-like domain-containing protein n=1 Tax=Lentzea sokolovensis TaxID=3095429 RepID=A0ABU4VGC7_9PSEU|nr:rhodanese-like domain-containing protein [Lentzea sp. BCCO 10_0061]MDX8149943.1 rhodanese-like domain-containing protein [Lentzea sp. BCCO 10_0061]